MQRSDSSQTAKKTHRRVVASTTLNRRYVKKPVSQTSSGLKVDVAVKTPKQKISHFNTQPQKKVVQREKDEPARSHPTQTLANQRLKARQAQLNRTQTTRPTAQQLKEQAIRKALLNASRQDEVKNTNQEVEIQNKKARKLHFGFGKILFALSCATVAVFAIVYFVNLNMPDIQFRAAASQFNASYPNYIPYNYRPVEIASENNVITLNFKNQTNGETFSIIEEKSSWDSNALLNNYVLETIGNDYVIIREQGLTIYANDSNAAWVNGGTVYKLKMTKGTLSKKQISSIATSL